MAIEYLKEIKFFNDNDMK